MRCAIWYHLYNLKNVKNTHEGVLTATLLKLTLLHACLSHFLNCTNDAKSRNASHKIKPLHIILPKTSTYIKRYDGKTNLIYFVIDGNEFS